MPQFTPMYTTMRTTKGFTLIELIIVMVITGIIVSMASVFLISGFKNYFTGVRVSGLNTQATLAMARMIKELQQAVSFSTINATNVTFNTSGGSNISYSWSSPTLTRTGIAAQTLSDQVTTFALTYYQSNFTATATPTAVRAITISMTLNNGNENIPIINTIFLNNMG